VTFPKYNLQFQTKTLRKQHRNARLKAPCW